MTDVMKINILSEISLKLSPDEISDNKGMLVNQ